MTPADRGGERGAEVKRYAPTIDAGGEHGMETAVMAERRNGPYVFASAYDALAAERDQLAEALTEARRSAYIRGFQRGYDKKAATPGSYDYEHIRALAEAHASSYCEQFDDAALSGGRT